MPLILPGNVASATAATGYDVDNSCRFNSGDSAYMHKTPGGAGNRRTFTISVWVKRGTLGANQFIISAGPDGSSQAILKFTSGDTLFLGNQISGSMDEKLITNRVFRDCSAWYHIVCSFDTTDGTEGDRTKIYINGVQETSFSTEAQPALNYDWHFNLDQIHEVGKEVAGSNYFDGYMAEFVGIDGTAYAATSFGEFDSDSPTIWKPIDVSGLTFGTNGFYLDFEASDNLGNDANGGTDLTEVNLAATDQTTDTCTNNFATLNPLDNYLAGATLSEGNTKQVTHAGNETYNTTTIGASSGKWYCEMKHISSSGGSALTTRTMYGIADGPTAQSDSQGTGNVYIFRSDGNQFSGSTESSSWGTAWNSTGEIIGIAMDLDNNKLYFAVNGTWQNSGDPTSGATGTGALAITADKTYFFVAGDLTGSVITNYMNFGNPLYANSSSVADADGYGDFEYAPPSGYYALCTKNLGAYGG